MKERFSIIKSSYLWVSIGFVILIVAGFLFFANARYSEEFTGGVKINVVGQLDTEQVTQDILGYMEEKGYKNNVVGVQLEENNTRLSLRTEVEKDEQVNLLSKDVQNILIEKGYIQSTNDVLEQSITGPSV